MPCIMPDGPIFVECTLPADDHNPADDRVVWRARSMNCNEGSQYFARLDEVGKIDSDTDRAAALNVLIRYATTGWTNVTDERGNALPMDDEALAQLSVAERYAIAYQLPRAADLAAMKRGNIGHRVSEPVPPLPPAPTTK